MPKPSARERFCTVLAHGPLLQADAIVVLCGEDGEERLKVGAELMLSGGASQIVLSGGQDDGVRWLGADRLCPVLMGKGVAFDRIYVEGASQNTREQAVAVVARAATQEWGRLLLVASAYHAPRAFLTFLKVLQEFDLTEQIQLVSVPASHTPWFKAPAGMETTRLALLEEEFRKIEAYREHVATYEEGLAYLKYWEGR